METTVEQLNYCHVKVICKADKDDISKAKEDVLKYFKDAPVPGYRKGKQTADVIKAHYRTQINESAKRALTEEAYHDAIFKHNIRTYGTPEIKNVLFSDLTGFSCELILFTKPDFELAKFKEFEVVKPHEEMTISDLTEKILQGLRVRFGSVVPYTEDDFAQTGDSLIINYEAFVDGVKNDIMSAEGEMLSLGSSKMIDFDNNLLGAKIGEVRSFDMMVPDSAMPSLVGKSVTFKVTVVMGSKTIPCPLDDELAKNAGKENYQELRQFVEASASAKLQAATKIKLAEIISKKLVEEIKFVVPDWMSLSEAKYLAASTKLNWDNLPNEDKEKYVQMGEQNVRLSLILDRIREEEPESQLSDSETLEMIKQHLINSNVETKSMEDALSKMNKSGYLQVLFARLKDEFTLDFVIKNVKIVE